MIEIVFGIERFFSCFTHKSPQDFFPFFLFSYRITYKFEREKRIEVNLLKLRIGIGFIYYLLNIISKRKTYAALKFRVVDFNVNHLKCGMQFMEESIDNE